MPGAKQGNSKGGRESEKIKMEKLIRLGKKGEASVRVTENSIPKWELNNAKIERKRWGDREM